MNQQLINVSFYKFNDSAGSFFINRNLDGSVFTSILSSSALVLGSEATNSMFAVEASSNISYGLSFSSNEIMNTSQRDFPLILIQLGRCFVQNFF